MSPHTLLAAAMAVAPGADGANASAAALADTAIREFGDFSGPAHAAQAQRISGLFASNGGLAAAAAHLWSAGFRRTLPGEAGASSSEVQAALRPLGLSTGSFGQVMLALRLGRKQVGNKATYPVARRC